MTDLLRERYTRLLRWYPVADRADRGAEIVDTYVDLAATGQRRPRPADAVDLMAGGLRQRLRAHSALGLADALPVAGSLALMMTTVLAAVWLINTESPGVWHDPASPMLGPFHSIGTPTWVAWLLAPLAAPLGLGRWAVAAAITVTAAVAVAVSVVPWFEMTALHPPLFLLVAQIGLGLAALAADNRRGLLDTAVVIAPAAVAAALAAMVVPEHQIGREALSVAALILVTAVVVLGVFFTARRDRRGWWPAALLVWPVLLLGMGLSLSSTYSFASRKAVVVWAVASLLAAVAVLTLAVRRQAWRARRRAEARILHFHRVAEQAAAEAKTSPPLAK
ncbi:hypothetical protein M1L60_24215 [Actinoplanes sp. TRM 88003]|uniref:Uncharacterized protein n=1 Tax=Paractinoplanes aksuensis TaxID=2939490 RepID=A0ABT1DSA5_9ACTN|nr:hypothetical protein [Actinoplanes aksuensis]MCO8273705.1 hypothetical protein [Actinoplanes aksuensis]